ncbi:hypothetical protein SDC9_147342 [bioreactor metagenome]|uniref:Uncharacterized protein n=1 Tax=bioreactor metagenome TaxID=1076179 RepID=A0A645EDR8_9ZZZZ
MSEVGVELPNGPLKVLQWSPGPRTDRIPLIVSQHLVEYVLSRLDADGIKAADGLLDGLLFCGSSAHSVLCLMGCCGAG